MMYFLSSKFFPHEPQAGLALATRLAPACRGGSERRYSVRIPQILAVFCLGLTLSFTAGGCGKLENPEQALSDAANAAAAGRWETAADLAGRCVRAERQNVAALTLHGIALYQLRQADEAIDALERAVTLAPQDFAANFFLGWILCEARRYSDALPPLQQALKARKGHPDTLALLARCCLYQGLPQGMGYLQALRLHKTHAQGPEIYNAMGILWLYQRQYDKAAKSFQDALSRSPNNPTVLQNLAVLNDQYLRRPAEAAKLYNLSRGAAKAADDHERATRIERRLRQLAAEPATGG